MATNLGSLHVSLEADIARFQSDMGKAAHQTEQAMQRMSQAADIAKGALAFIGVGASISAIVGRLASMGKQAIDSMDALNDLADATSSSIEKLSALEDVAARSGSNFDVVSTAMLKFNKLLTDAKPGSEAEAGLKALGLEAKKLKDLDPADAMLQYAQALDKFADDGNKARLVQEQTGKSVKELAPFLKDLAAQHELVATVTTQQAQEAEKFNKELFNMQKNAQDVARYLASDMVAAINSTAQAFRDGKKEGASFFDVAGKRYADWVKDFYGIAKNTGGASGSWGGAGGSWEAPPQPKPSVVVTEKPTKPTGGKPKDPDADFKAYMKQLEGQISKVQELTATEKLLNDMRSGSLSVNAGQEATLKGIASEIDATKEAIRVSTQRVTLRRKDEQDSISAIRQIEAEAAQQKQLNAANVAQIQISLMSEVDQEVRAYGLRMQSLQLFHDDKLENVQQANAAMEAETARHEQAKAAMQASYAMQGLSMAGNSADQLYNLLQKASMEQSALGKAVFLASKALAVAEIIINTEVAAAKATAMFPVYGTALAMGIRVAGYASAGLVGGMAIAEASAEGGYDIPSGVNPMTQLHEKEMVLPRAQADVIRDLASNGGGGGAPVTWTIVNNTSAPIGRVTEQRISSTERALIIEEAKAGTAASFGDPNSVTSRSLNRNFNINRSR